MYIAKAVTAGLDTTISEHLANAAKTLDALCTASFQLQAGDSFEGLCRRCEANLDGLRIAGGKAISLGLGAAEDDSAAAGVVALLLAESENCQPEASEQATMLLRRESLEICKAAWWGLRLASSQYVEPHLRALADRGTWEFASAAALDILAFHRLPVHVELSNLANGDNPEVAWLLAEAGGRLPDAWNRTHLALFISHRSSRVREAALRASARCGLPELAALCRAVASEREPLAPEVVEFLGVIGSREDLPQLLHLTSDPLFAKAAVAANRSSGAATRYERRRIGFMGTNSTFGFAWRPRLVASQWGRIRH
ncbi:MAG TPA: hypothetical protein VE422_07245 [Terriglobia bacterium]|nr:hypothetical protein [Terriglobia bacterium]